MRTSILFPKRLEDTSAEKNKPPVSERNGLPSRTSAGWALQRLAFVLALSVSLLPRLAALAEPASGAPARPAARPVPSAVTAFVGGQVLLPGSMTYADAHDLIQDDKIIGVGPG